MRQGKARAAITLLFATLTLALVDPSRATERGGWHQDRTRGGPGSRGVAIQGTAAAARPYGYGDAAAPLSPSFPYANPYSQRSSGCCHGRN